MKVRRPGRFGRPAGSIWGLRQRFRVKVAWFEFCEPCTAKPNASTHTPSNDNPQQQQKTCNKQIQAAALKSSTPKPLSVLLSSTPEVIYHLWGRFWISSLKSKMCSLKELPGSRQAASCQLISAHGPGTAKGSHPFFAPGCSRTQEAPPEGLKQSFRYSIYVEGKWRLTCFLQVASTPNLSSLSQDAAEFLFCTRLLQIVAPFPQLSRFRLA